MLRLAHFVTGRTLEFTYERWRLKRRCIAQCAERGALPCTRDGAHISEEGHRLK
jgi:hypothetical protein